MDLMLICKDGLASSLLTNLVVASEARKSGVNVGVLFTGEALAAVCGGVFLWPRGLQEQELRYQMSDNAKEAGIPTWGRGQWRQVDPYGMLSKAIEAGVTMFACPVWTGLLGLKGGLPSGVKTLGYADMLDALRSTKTVIGAL